jgi:CRISPR-associated endonuclease/helicase Cas3
MRVEFEDFFKAGSGGKNPRPCQIQLAKQPWPETWVIPTGFGKTAGVLAAWIWKVAQKDADTPRRLVYCLPMRTLVEQTENAIKPNGADSSNEVTEPTKGWLAAAKAEFGLEIEFHVLMGGRSRERSGTPGWIMKPERPAILVGTQDILVSAAVMRGYGVSRYRWPVDFALLNNDAFWVFDEVQLTGATLATSAQLEAFRRKLQTGRNCRTLWMSATLNPTWLKTADFTPVDKCRSHDLSAADLAEAPQLWHARKSLQPLQISSGDLNKKTEKAYAAQVAKHAVEKTKPGTNTIVFLNTVRRAQAVFDALKKNAELDVILVHSRFRKADRDERMRQLRADPPAQGRIIVATQALEAGVDVTSATMITEIAPWSSLVQRFGRCNRYGECGEVGADIFWVDLPDSETEARPYTLEDLTNARAILKGSSDRGLLSACGPSDLAAIPPSAPPRGAVIRRRDLLDLFDTDPDLSGFDVDISLYVRDADDTDVRMFWRPTEKAGPPEDAPEPEREELCPVPIGGTKELLGRKRDPVKAWRWDALAKRWRSTNEKEVFPGMTLWVDAKCGGYDAEKGFDPEANTQILPVQAPAPGQAEQSMGGDPDTASKVRVSLARHAAHVRDEARVLSESLHLSTDDRDLLLEAALWHDLGKAHEAFVALTTAALTDGVRPPLAKWPAIKGEQRPSSPRKYFRHELVSALAYLAHHDWSKEASLAAYLIAAHHGKVRMRIRALPNERPAEPGKLFARGVTDGDVLPETILDSIAVPATALDLDIMQLGEGRCGQSWQARTQALLKQYGPFRLAWLEALLRIADWRASAAEEEAGHDDL